MQFLSSDKLLGVPEQMLCKLRHQEELHSQTAFCRNEGKATEAKHTQLRTSREESHIPICISLRGWKEKKNRFYKAKSDNNFFFLFPFMPRQIRIRRTWKLHLFQETNRAVKMLPKKLALWQTHAQKLHSCNFPFIATESACAPDIRSLHTITGPLTRFRHCKQTSAVCNHMRMIASTKYHCITAWEQLTFQTKAHEPFPSREPHFLLELN